MSMNISKELNQAAARKNVTQLSIARQTYRAHTTISGYFNSEDTPLPAMQELASVLDDSIFSHQMSHKTFGTLPAMESEVFQDTPHALDMLSEMEAAERKARKNEALMVLCKQDNYLTDQDKTILSVYANEFLDEMLIETKLVMSILEKTNTSFMQAIADRVPYWIQKNYLGK